MVGLSGDLLLLCWTEEFAECGSIVYGLFRSVVVNCVISRQFAEESFVELLV